MYDTMIMEIGHRGKRGTDEICCIRFVITTFAANSVKEFTPKCEISDEVYWESMSVQSRDTIIVRPYSYSWFQSNPPESGYYDDP